MSRKHCHSILIIELHTNSPYKQWGGSNLFPDFLGSFKGHKSGIQYYQATPPS